MRKRPCDVNALVPTSSKAAEEGSRSRRLWDSVSLSRPLSPGRLGLPSASALKS